MNDNNFNDEFFSGESKDDFYEPEKATQENEDGDFNGNVNIEQDFTPDEYEEPSHDEVIPEAPVTFFNDYSGEKKEDTEPEQEFNPYAPRQSQDNSQTYQGVNTGYTNINQSQQYRTPQQSPYYQQNPSFNHDYRAYQTPPKRSRGGKSVLGIIIVACLAVAIIGVTLSIFGNDSNETQTTLPPVSSQAQGITDGPTVTSDNIEVSTTQPVTQVVNSVYVADKVRPSVVGVMVYVNGKLSNEGSGVLMSEKDGWTYIVTCAHVISDANVSYGVLLLDGRRYEAELVAYDTRTDIGVVKVEATGLPLAEFGDSTSLRVGEPVYAIGNPGGSEYFGSITNGIVSAIDRSVTSTYTMTCIQHNAAINPGNSGGALVNAAGQVIGINSSKIASTEYEGMGFAVPTSIASPIVNSLIQYGYVPNRPKLGIEYAPVSAYQLYSLVVSIKGLPQGSLVIAGISEDSSLANTEAEVGDLIIAVNGKKMDDTSVLLDLIETGSVGDTLKLTLCRIESRTYKTSTFDVTISLIEDKPTTTQPTEPTMEFQDDGYYRGGQGSFEDFFNDYFGW